MNHNGESPLSDALLVHACVAPDPPPLLERLTGDATTITLAWQAPIDDGGCPITGYQLKRDSGLGIGDTITTEVDAGAINSRPALREHQVVLSTSETGLPIRFQLTAINAEGSAVSEIFRFILAALPSKPPSLVSVAYAEGLFKTLN